MASYEIIAQMMHLSVKTKIIMNDYQNKKDENNNGVSS